jgi:hypothetical protein
MTAKEVIDDLRAMGPQDVRVIFHYLADRAIDARLAEGQRICDVSDVVAWLRELAEAAKESEGNSSESDGTFRTRPKVTERPAQARWAEAAYNDAMAERARCPDCFHVHSGRYECTEYLGEGRFCKCSSKVPA